MVIMLGVGSMLEVMVIILGVHGYNDRGGTAPAHRFRWDHGIECGRTCGDDGQHDDDDDALCNKNN